MSLKVAVVGVGAFGRNHARVLRALEEAGKTKLAAIVDASAQARDTAAATYGVPVFASVKELIASSLKIDAAVVAVPTIAHASTAKKLMEAGADVLIEKPVAVSMTEAQELQAVAERLKRVVMVGH
ncbi:MAG: Gfo/Idh/MocA family oxidoreductase, partial [Sinobacteraceae bacterium]|nr:Gfo/Idh/MocA family oxidoreductase [Nevskiaceae bacterium]